MKNFSSRKSDLVVVYLSSRGLFILILKGIYRILLENGLACQLFYLQKLLSLFELEEGHIFANPKSI